MGFEARTNHTSSCPFTREQQLESALREVLRLLIVNDTSADKSHPWIPGADAGNLKKRIERVLA